jgi:hypothetical protein
MEIIVDTDYLDIIWNNSNIFWDSSDTGSQSYLYCSGIGFAGLNSTKDDFGPIIEVPNLMKVQSWSASDLDPVLILTEGFGLYKYYPGADHWQFIWGNVRDGHE